MSNDQWCDLTNNALLRSATDYKLLIGLTAARTRGALSMAMDPTVLHKLSCLCSNISFINNRFQKKTTLHSLSLIVSCVVVMFGFSLRYVTGHGVTSVCG